MRNLYSLFQVFGSCFLSLSVSQEQIDTSHGYQTMFTASVYEHIVHRPHLQNEPLTREQALLEMRPNMLVYEEVAQTAKARGSDILVFPEDGIYGYSFHKDRSQVFPFLEFIPDVHERVVLCNNNTFYTDSEIQRNLSCMAKDNKLFIVANVGAKQICNKQDQNCPADGFYQFNTDVVYDSEGYLVAKCHKYHLYYEYQFDTPTEPEYVTFYTPFGTFGIITSYDIMFKDPAVKIIQQHSIENIVFPVAWVDYEPYMSGIQFHSAFAIAHGINLLVANVHFPRGSNLGSGIYTRNGAVAYYYNKTDESPAKLTTATIPARSKINYLPETFTPEAMTEERFTGSFTSVLFHDTHNLVPLQHESGKAIVCHNDLCCTVSYNDQMKTVDLSDEWESSMTEDEFYALSAYSNNHTSKTFFLQVCLVVKCRQINGRFSCGRWRNDISPNLNITSFTLSGNFSSAYVYPSVLLKHDGQIKLTSYPKKWSYQNGTLKWNVEQSDSPLEVGSMVARVYDRDFPMIRY